MTEVSTTEKPGPSYYDILEVAPNATEEEIWQSYRRLRNATYPLPFPSEKSGASDLTAIDARLKELFKIYFLLAEPDLREIYDRTGTFDWTAKVKLQDPVREERQVASMTRHIIEHTQVYVVGDLDGYDKSVEDQAARALLDPAGREVLTDLSSIYLAKSTAYLHRSTGSWTGKARATAIEAKASIEYLSKKAALFSASLEVVEAEEKWKVGAGSAIGGEEKETGEQWKRFVQPKIDVQSKAGLVLKGFRTLRQTLDRVLSPTDEDGQPVPTETLVKRAEALKRTGQIFERAGKAPSPYIHASGTIRLA